MKFAGRAAGKARLLSHPARGAWIEILAVLISVARAASHPARGAWIEILAGRTKTNMEQSHPARGAWIEMVWLRLRMVKLSVAPRKGCVD